MRPWVNLQSPDPCFGLQPPDRSVPLERHFFARGRNSRRLTPCPRAATPVFRAAPHAQHPMHQTRFGSLLRLKQRNAVLGGFRCS
eukprot:11963415-Alexandrium_andersonii.AAC.1